MTRNFSIDRKKIYEFCKNHRIKKLSLFGSVLREDFTADSDIDVLVEFKDFSTTPGLFEFVELQEELSSIFGGRRIDLVTINALRDHLRQEILKTAEVQYEEAA